MSHKDSVFMLNTTVLLLAIPKIKNNEGIVTGKIFEYLASKTNYMHRSGMGMLQRLLMNVLQE